MLASGYQLSTITNYTRTQARESIPVMAMRQVGADGYTRKVHDSSIKRREGAWSACSVPRSLDGSKCAMIVLRCQCC